MKRAGARKLVIVLFWLSVWQMLALRVDNPILLVTPVRAALALAELLGEFLFWQTVGCSLLRIAVGFFMGVAAALALAALASRFPLLEEVLSPVVTLLKAVPVASFVVLLLIWWGSAYLAVAVCFLVVLPGVYISTLEGLKAADKRLLEMAAVFHMPVKNSFFYIYRPALQPFLLSSLKLALGMCWKSGVAAEVIGTPAFSIGERLYLSKIYLETADVFAWTAAVILLSLCFEKLVLRLAEAFFAWEPACSAAGKGRKGAGAAPAGKGRKGTGAAPAGKGRKDAGAALACRKVTKSYGSLELLRNLDAVYEPGQTYYLTSPSGSGKTTLFRLLCGLETPDEGSVEPKLRFSFCFQEDRLCEEYSAVRNVEMVLGSERRRAHDRRRDCRRDCGRAEAALRLVLAEDSLHKPCSRLSGGMKRRVSLVRAMEAESDCVLLDEPFAGMDAETKRRAEEYIRSRQRGRIVIIATHV